MGMRQENSTVNAGTREAGAAPGDRFRRMERARDIARRYRCEFVDLSDFSCTTFVREDPCAPDVPYNFVPLDETADGRLAIAIADPTIDDDRRDQPAARKRIVTKVSTLKQISDILKRPSVQRVLETASEGFTLDVIREDEAGNDETHPPSTSDGDGAANEPIIR